MEPLVRRPVAPGPRQRRQESPNRNQSDSKPRGVGSTHHQHAAALETGGDVSHLESEIRSRHEKCYNNTRLCKLECMSTDVEIKRRCESLDSILDERSLRQFAAAEADSIGYGGVSRCLASLVGSFDHCLGQQEIAGNHQVCPLGEFDARTPDERELVIPPA